MVTLLWLKSMYEVGVVGFVSDDGDHVCRGKLGL